MHQKVARRRHFLLASKADVGAGVMTERRMNAPNTACEVEVTRRKRRPVRTSAAAAVAVMNTPAREHVLSNLHSR
jgi:hypothetical protein